MDFRAIRKRHKLSQQVFWNNIGVTQSGGSRYETGRDAPVHVKAIVYMVYCAKPDKTFSGADVQKRVMALAKSAAAKAASATTEEQ